MKEVLEQARQLGQAIEQSQIHREMRATEDAVMSDPESTATLNEYADLKMELQQMLEQENPDQVALNEKSERLQDLQDQLNQLEKVQQMIAARTEFTQMMNQVNQVIQFMITGEDADCGGDCGGCGGGCGCGHAH